MAKKPEPRFDYILAVDPGPEESGWLSYNARTCRPMKFGISPNEELVRKMIPPPEPALLAIEMVGHYGSGMPVGKTVFNTCIWIGRFIQAWTVGALIDVRPTAEEYRLILRATVKAHICGSARAKDSNVRQALIDRYGETRQAAIGTKAKPCPLHGVKSHIWAALALAITAAETDGGD